MNISKVIINTINTSKDYDLEVKSEFVKSVMTKFGKSSVFKIKQKHVSGLMEYEYYLVYDNGKKVSTKKIVHDKSIEERIINTLVHHADSNK